MPQFETRKRVNHSVADMFDLVADVEQYPRFVPLCQTLVVRSRRPLGEHREVLVADMTVAYKMFKETFTTKVVLDRIGCEIFVEYLDGPFRYLENRWTFTETGPKSSEICFYISYEFRSRMLATVAGAVFDQAFRRFSSAFEDRADQVYGPAPA